MIRILSNLLNNSLHQIRDNKCGNIYLTAEIYDTVNILRFKDTAGGIHQDRMEHLFSGYNSNKMGGTGIGLAFCKLTMENFGGDISCQSVYGEYVEFSLIFPKIQS